MKLDKAQHVMRGEIDEFDLRLPYKRFKELYPWSNITCSKGVQKGAQLEQQQKNGKMNKSKA